MNLSHVLNTVDVESSCVVAAVDCDVSATATGAEPRLRLSALFKMLGSRFSFWPGTIDILAILHDLSDWLLCSFSCRRLSFLLTPNTPRLSSVCESEDEERLSINVSGYELMSPVADMYLDRTYGCSGGNVC